MSNLVSFLEKILIRLLSFSLAFCLSLIAFLPSLNFHEKPELRQLKVEIVKPQSNEKCESPNPLNLVLDIYESRNIKLNGENVGSLGDTTNLENKLAKIFLDRSTSGVYNKQRTEIEKTVIIRSNETINYGELVKFIDELNKIGANVIIDSDNEYYYCLGSHCRCNRFRLNEALY